MLEPAPSSKKEPPPTRRLSKPVAPAAEVPTLLATKFPVPTVRKPGRFPHMPGYEILGELGRGGMGVVYKAKQLRLSRIVALKMLLHPEDADPSDVIRFRSEAEAVAAVKHPHIVQVHEFGLHEGDPFFTMEFLNGGNLHARLRREAPFDSNTSAKLVEKLARAVQAAHTQGIVHRDLKPGNVLFDNSGEPRITDFGLAKRFSHQLTRTQAIMGTPGYMPPEQAAGNAKSAGPGADIYALGVILFECVTGVLPFAGEDSMSLLHRVIHDPAPSLRSKNRKLPRDLDLICMKCLEKHPNDRYPTAAALADDLARFVSKEPVSVRPAGPLERAVKWAKRRPTLAAAYGLASLAFVLIFLASGIAALWRSAASARDSAEVHRKNAEEAKWEIGAQKKNVDKANYELEMKNAELSKKGKQLTEKNRQVESAMTELGEKKKEVDAALSELNLQQTTLRHVQYFRNVGMAQKELHDRNFLRAIQLLEGCPGGLRGWEWWHVYKAAHPERAYGNSSHVPIDAAFDSATGFNVNTVDRMGAITRFKFQAGVGAAEQFHPSLGVNTMKLSADGTRAFTIGTNENHPAKPFEITVWSIAKGEVVSKWAAPVEITTAEAISGNGQRIVYISPSGFARAFDVASRKELPRLPDIPYSPVNVRLGHTGTLAVIPNGKELLVWELATGKIPHRLPLPADPVEVTAVGPEEKILAYGTRTGTLVFDSLAAPNRGKAIRIPKAHVGPISNIAFHADRGIAATAGEDGAVRIWELASGKMLREYYGHTRRVHGLNFHTRGDFLVSSDDDFMFRVWPVDTPKSAILDFAAPEGGNGKIVYDAEGVRVFALGVDRNAVLFPNQSNAHRLLAPEGQRITAAAFHPKKGQVAFGTDRGWLYVWDYPGIPVLIGDLKAAVEKVEYSAEGSRLLTARPRMVAVWDTHAKRLMKEWPIYFENGAAAISPDGKWIASGFDNVLLGYAVDDNRCVHCGIEDRISCLGFTPNSEEFVVGTRNWRLQTFKIANPNEITRNLKGHTTAIRSFAFSPDGKQLATGGRDGAIKVWDWKTEEEAIGLKTPEREPVIQLQFAPGKGLLAWNGDAPVLFDGEEGTLAISASKDQPLESKKPTKP